MENTHATSIKEILQSPTLAFRPFSNVEVSAVPELELPKHNGGDKVESLLLAAMTSGAIGLVQQAINIDKENPMTSKSYLALAAGNDISLLHASVGDFQSKQKMIDVILLRGHTETEHQKVLNWENEKGEADHPAIYGHALVNENGEGLRRDELELLLEKLWKFTRHVRKYIELTYEEDDTEFEDDEIPGNDPRLRFPVNSDRDGRSAEWHLRKILRFESDEDHPRQPCYTEHSKIMKSSGECIGHWKVCVRWLLRMEQRLPLMVTADERMCPPIGEIGYAKNVGARMRQHNNFTSTTTILLLVGMGCRIYFPSYKFRGKVLCELFLPDQARFAEPLYTTITSSYVWLWGANKSVAGRSVASYDPAVRANRDQWVDDFGVHRTATIHAGAQDIIERKLLVDRLNKLALAKDLNEEREEERKKLAQRLADHLEYKGNVLKREDELIRKYQGGGGISDEDDDEE